MSAGTAGSVLSLVMLVAACGEGDPPGSLPPDAQVPPPDAGPVEILSVSLDVGERAIVGVEGTKPTPCHEVGWIAGDRSGEITIWSEPPPPDVACAQVIEPFSIEIDLGPLEAGTEVVINGEVVGTA